jgi:hypothetical protein
MPARPHALHVLHVLRVRRAWERRKPWAVRPVNRPCSAWFSPPTRRETSRRMAADGRIGAVRRHDGRHMQASCATSYPSRAPPTPVGRNSKLGPRSVPRARPMTDALTKTPMRRMWRMWRTKNTPVFRATHEANSGQALPIQPIDPSFMLAMSAMFATCDAPAFRGNRGHRAGNRTDLVPGRSPTSTQARLIAIN